MGVLVRLIGSGVGLAAEAIAHKQSNSRSRPEVGDPEGEPSSSRGRQIDAPPAYEDVVEIPAERADELVRRGQAVPFDSLTDSSKENIIDDDIESSSDDDEAVWALDDAVETVETQSTEQPKPKYGVDAQPTLDSFASTVMAICPPAPKAVSQIPLPVIVPQRRPGSNQRGFVRAYSPTLEGNGIPQTTFLTFLKAFHDASRASPVLNVVFLSAAIVGMVPEAIAQITATVVQLAAGTAIELQKRQRTNTFLDVMNEQLFKPRKLYAMVMTYQPNAHRSVSAASMDPTELISKWTSPDTKQWKKTLKASSGKSYGDIELPESAPLVFPALDEVVDTGDKEKANKMKGSMKFISDYYDRRGQAVYAHQNPSKMPLPVAEGEAFKHQLSDPSHPAFQGSWLTLFSGGYIPPKEQRFGRQGKPKRTRRKDRPVRNPYAPIGALRTLGQRRRAMKAGMLYLMVVNMPTDEELESARQQLQQAEEREKAGKRSFLSF